VHHQAQPFSLYKLILLGICFSNGKLTKEDDYKRFVPAPQLGVELISPFIVSGWASSTNSVTVMMQGWF
jgi:hypothetical protein